MRLVLPGNHGEFADWLRLVYGPGGGQGDPPARPVLIPNHLRGIDARNVDSFHQVGTYWNNPMWGSDHYRFLMEDGLVQGKVWAMEWDLDFRKAEAQRYPIEPGELAAARDGLVRLARELNGDA